MMKTSPQTHGLDELLAFMLSDRARPKHKAGRKAGRKGGGGAQGRT